jgi:hypothetical protein
VVKILRTAVLLVATVGRESLMRSQQVSGHTADKIFKCCINYIYEKLSKIFKFWFVSAALICCYGRANDGGLNLLNYTRTKYLNVV